MIIHLIFRIWSVNMKIPWTLFCKRFRPFILHSINITDPTYLNIHRSWPFHCLFRTPIYSWSFLNAPWQFLSNLTLKVLETIENCRKRSLHGRNRSLKAQERSYKRSGTVNGFRFSIYWGWFWISFNWFIAFFRPDFIKKLIFPKKSIF